MVDTWLGTSWTELGLIVASTAGILLWGIVVIRVVGLRSLSKMSSIDFVVTVALGSVVATTAGTSASLAHGLLTFALLLAVQWTFSVLRRRWPACSNLIDNEPIMLMDGAQLLQHNLDRAQVTRADVIAKLREANVTAMDQVLGVVFETTGDISVLHGAGPLDEQLLEGVSRPARR